MRVGGMFVSILLFVLLLSGAVVQGKRVVECGALTVPGETYELSTDIVFGEKEGVCFSIEADNITFDGMGFSISGTPYASHLISIQVLNAYHVEVRNCKINQVSVGFFLRGCVASVVANNYLNVAAAGIKESGGAQNSFHDNYIIYYAPTSSALHSYATRAETLGAYAPNLVAQATIDSITVSWDANTAYQFSQYELDILLNGTWTSIYSGLDTQSTYDHLFPNTTYSLRFRAVSDTETSYLNYQTTTGATNYMGATLWDNTVIRNIAVDKENDMVYAFGANFSSGALSVTSYDLAGNPLRRIPFPNELTQIYCSAPPPRYVEGDLIVVGDCNGPCLCHVDGSVGTFSCASLDLPLSAGLTECALIVRDLQNGNSLIFGSNGNQATIIVVTSEGSASVVNPPETAIQLTTARESPTNNSFYVGGIRLDDNNTIISNLAFQLLRSGSTYTASAYVEWSTNILLIRDSLVRNDSTLIAFVGEPIASPGSVAITMFGLDPNGSILSDTLSNTVFSPESFYTITQSLFFPIWQSSSFPEIVVAGAVLDGNAFPGFSPAGGDDVFFAHINSGELLNVTQYGTKFNDSYHYTFVDLNDQQVFLFTETSLQASNSYSLAFRRYFPPVDISAPSFELLPFSMTNMAAIVTWPIASIFFTDKMTYMLELTDSGVNGWYVAHNGTETNVTIPNLTPLTSYQARLSAWNGGSLGVVYTGFTVPDLDECQFHPCDPLVSCTNTQGGYICGDCPAGYAGTGNTTCYSVCTEQNIFRCKNQTCAHSASDCIVPQQQCTSGMFPCASGGCVSSLYNCPKQACSGSSVNCWDGSCAPRLDNCPSVPACPALTQRCSDGTCQETCSQQTCPASQSQCTNGYCGYCGPFSGCPAYVPVLCSNGSCAATASQCRTSACPGGFVCFDGSCSINNVCPTPPRLVQPVPFSIILPIENVSVSSLPVKVISSTLATIAQVNLPNSLLPNRSDQLVQFFVDAVPDSDLVGVGGFGVQTNSSFASNILTSVISLTLRGNTTSYGTNFTDGVVISFFNALPPNTNVSDLCLAYVNEGTQEWLCESDVTISDDGAIVGRTSHFTTFMVLGKVKAPHVNPLTPDDFGNLGKVTRNTTGVYVVAGIFFVYFVGLIFTLIYDKRHAPQNISIGSDLGEIKKHAVSFVDLADLPTTIEEASSPHPHPKSPEPAVPKPSEQSRPRLKIKERSHRYVKHSRRLCMEKFREKHTWLAIFFSRSGRFARTDMLTLLLVTVLGNLVINAIFYDRSGDVKLAQKIIIGLITGSIMFPISFFFAILLSKLPPRYKGAAYAFALSFCVACAVLVVVYSLDFGEKKAKDWLMSFAISSIQDCVANQPLKFLIISLVVACCPTTFIAILL